MPGAGDKPGLGEAREAGRAITKDPQWRHYLASFVGRHMFLWYGNRIMSRGLSCGSWTLTGSVILGAEMGMGSNGCEDHCQPSKRWVVFDSCSTCITVMDSYFESADAKQSPHAISKAYIRFDR